MSHLFEAAVQAASYAKFRPQPPPNIISHVIDFVKETLSSERSAGLNLAVDVGCGSGQCTKLLAEHFKTVHGFDTSANQIKHANENNAFENVTYGIANGHSIPVNDNSVDLVTLAQSFHWLDTAIFYPELNRILKRNGVVAVISYEMPFLALNERKSVARKDHSDAIRQLIRRFYGHSKLKPHWAAKERYVVDTALRTVVLPFSNQIRIEDSLVNDGVSASSIVGYIHSWSAFQLLKEKSSREADAFIDEFNCSAKEICGHLDADCFSLEFPFNLLMAKKT